MQNMDPKNIITPSNVMIGAFTVYQLAQYFFKDKEKLNDANIELLKKIQTIYKSEFYETKADAKGQLEHNQSYLPEVLSYDEKERPRAIPDADSINPSYYEKHYGSNELTNYAKTIVGIICAYQKQAMKARIVGKSKLWDTRGLFSFFIKYIVVGFSTHDLSNPTVVSSIKKLLKFILRVKNDVPFKSWYEENFTKCLATLEVYLIKIDEVVEKHGRMLSAREKAQTLISLIQVIFYDGVNLALRIPCRKIPEMNMNLITLTDGDDSKADRLTVLQKYIRAVGKRNPAVYVTETAEQWSKSPFIFDRPDAKQDWQIASTCLLPPLLPPLEDDKLDRSDLTKQFLAITKKERQFYNDYLQFLGALEQLGENSKYVILLYRLAGETGNWGIYYQLGTPINQLCQNISQIVAHLEKSLNSIHEYLQEKRARADEEKITIDEGWFENITFVFSKVSKPDSPYRQVLTDISALCNEMNQKYKDWQNLETRTAHLQKIISQMAMFIHGVEQAARHLSKVGVAEIPKPSLSSKGTLFAIQHRENQDPKIYMDMKSLLQDAEEIVGVAMKKEQKQYDELKRMITTLELEQGELKKRGNFQVLGDIVAARKKRLALKIKSVEVKSHEVGDAKSPPESDFTSMTLENLWAFVEDSILNTSNAAIRAAGKALNELNHRGVSFSGKKLAGIHAHDVDLSYGICDDLQLSGAVFTGTLNLEHAWLHNASLENATFERIQFSENPVVKASDKEKVQIVGLAYSAKQKQLIFAAGGQVFFYDPATGNKDLSKMSVPKEALNVAFNVDTSRYMMTTYSRHTLQLGNLVSGVAPEIVKPTANVQCMAFSQDGTLGLSGHDDGKLYLWKGVVLIKTFSEHKDVIWGVAFSPDNQYCLSGGWDHALCLWDIRDIRNPKLHKKFLHFTGVMSVAFNHDGTRCLSGGADHVVRLWSTEQEDLRRPGYEFKGHADWVTQVAFNHDSTLCASASDDRTVRVWDVLKNVQLSCFFSQSSWNGQLVFSPDSAQCFLANSNGEIRVMNISQSTPAAQKNQPHHTGGVLAVAISPDSKLGLSGGADNTLRLWNLLTGYHIKTFTGHTDAVRCVAFGPDETQCLSGSKDHQIRLWSVTTGETMRVFNGHSGPINSVSFNRDGTRVLSGSDDHSIRLWDAKTGEVVHTFKKHTAPVCSVQFSTQETEILSGSDDSTLCLWNIPQRRVTTFFNVESRVRAVGSSAPSNSYLSGSDYNLQQWKFNSGKPYRNFLGHSDTIRSIAVHRDGKRFATVSEDCSLRLWDFNSDHCLAVVDGLTHGFNSVAWSSAPGVNYLLTGSNEGAVRCWEVEEEKRVVAAAKIRLRWSTHHTFFGKGLNIAGVRGLDAASQKLLQQEGATGHPYEAKETKGLIRS